LPVSVVNAVSGAILKQDQGVQILPITDSDNVEINQNSMRLIQSSFQTYAAERRVLQVR
jgi:hypothetical protein